MIDFPGGVRYNGGTPVNLMDKESNMEVKLGEHLRSLRRRDGRTQEDLAVALDVTPQAVSRWENGSCYPDMALIPSMANYFGVTIDELFGYKNDRDEKVDAIVQKVEAFQIKGRSDDEWVEECLGILRAGLAEFPQNEKLRITLADTLSEAGWRRYQEWLYYDGEGYLRRDYDRHRKNEFWEEAVEVCESLVSTAGDHAIVTRAVSILVLLYRNLGDTERAKACAECMPELKDCREVLLAASVDGKEEAQYLGDLLLKLAGQLSKHLIYALMTNRAHYENDLAMEKIKGVIALFDLVCDDGNLGEYHGELIKLNLYLSRVQWERGYRDDAFASLDEALRHARALERLSDGGEHSFTAPLVSFVKCRTGPCGDIAGTLPEDWPFCGMPECGQIEAEIKADPRWEKWGRACKRSQ